jgi:hypothetical protein
MGKDAEDNTPADKTPEQKQDRADHYAKEADKATGQGNGGKGGRG